MWGSGFHIYYGVVNVGCVFGNLVFGGFNGCRRVDHLRTELEVIKEKCVH